MEGGDDWAGFRTKLDRICLKFLYVGQLSKHLGRDHRVR